MITGKAIRIGEADLAALAEKLGRLPDKAEVELIAAGHAIARDTKRLCPVAEVDGGTLKASWSTEIQKFAGRLAFVVSTNIFYFPYVEYGTGRRGGSHYQHYEGFGPPPTFTFSWPGMLPQPHLRPSVIRNIVRFNERLRSIL